MSAMVMLTGLHYANNPKNDISLIIILSLLAWNIGDHFSIGCKHQEAHYVAYIFHVDDAFDNQNHPYDI